jgi:hypothetical protein
LYLSGDGSDPTTASIGHKDASVAKATGRLIVRGYAELIEWLQTCLGTCRAPNVQYFIEGFIKHIRVEFMGITDEANAEELARALIRSDDFLEAALAIYQSEVPLKTALLAKVVEQVRQSSEFFVARADIGPLKDSGLLLSFAEETNLSFGIQFDAKNFGYLFYGAESRNGKALRPAVKKALQEAIGSTAQTPWWPVWKRVGPNDRFFPLKQQVDTSFWLAANNGQLADMLLTFVDRMHDALASEGVLDLAAG